MYPVLYWGEMSASELLNCSKSDSSCLIIIPWGVTEAHGPSMQVDVDAKMARLIAHLAAEQICSSGVQPIIFDNIASMGIVGATDQLAGTVTYDGMLSADVLYQVIRSMYGQGFRHFFVVNGDGSTGDNWRGLLFFSVREQREFFAGWEGKFFFRTWFSGITQMGHACSYEHAFLKYVCDLADDHTRELARSLRLRADGLTQEALYLIEGKVRLYPEPREEINSWKYLPGQIETLGAAAFYWDEYQELLQSGRIARMWKEQMGKIIEHMQAVALNMEGEVCKNGGFSINRNGNGAAYPSSTSEAGGYSEN